MKEGFKDPQSAGETLIWDLGFFFVMVFYQSVLYYHVAFLSLRLTGTWFMDLLNPYNVIDVPILEQTYNTLEESISVILDLEIEYSMIEGVHDMAFIPYFDISESLLVLAKGLCDKNQESRRFFIRFYMKDRAYRHSYNLP